ncbi:hypothetical protein FRC19_004641 [Serendipita sp. 401]|nr:hypothetical protein FRC19_004641 [Serendipita sp. 401]KAG9052681.1 hypothetical protein FS842_009408 [Serendipita sp. 407]
MASGLARLMLSQQSSSTPRTKTAEHRPALLSKVCRHFSAAPVASKRAPLLAHLSWTANRYVIFGLRHEALPNDLDLSTPRVGRLINIYIIKKVGDHQTQEAIPIALFPADPSNKKVPPYPGVEPISLSTPMNEDSCFIDGSKGCWDPRRYPQLFNPRRPWLAFHVIEWDRRWGTPWPERGEPLDLFVWNSPGEPNLGGTWSHLFLRVLWARRKEVEGHFVSLAKDASTYCPDLCFDDPERLAESYDMPWYDPLDLETTLQWTTYLEGREKLGHMLLYTAEMASLCHWLSCRIKFAQGKEYKKIIDVMGTWAPTILKREDWEFLKYCHVPIYIITRIPEGHPALTAVAPGNLDADERYREDGFDAAHNLAPTWGYGYYNMFKPMNLPPLDSRPEYIPSELLSMQLHSYQSSKPTAHNLTWWHSPIFRSDEKFQITSETSIESLRHAAQVHREIDDMFRYVPPSLRILRSEVDRHPLLDVIGSRWAKDAKITRFEEEYDEAFDAYYPVKLGKAAGKRKINESLYLFQYLAEQIEIYSMYPFPGQSHSFGRIDHGDNSNDMDVAHINRSQRRYFSKQPVSTFDKPALTWTPTTPPQLDVPVVSMHGHSEAVRMPREAQEGLNLDPRWEVIIWVVPLDPIDPALLFPDRPSLLPSPPALMYHYTKELSDWEEQIELQRGDLQARLVTAYGLVRHHADIHTHDPMSTKHYVHQQEQEVKKLIEQRQRLRGQLRRRFFQPWRGDESVSSFLIMWSIPDTEDGAVCYPIRISCLDGDVTAEQLFAMLHCILKIVPSDIMLFSAYREVDTTHSFDLGFRFAEDALYARAILHGVMVDDRLLEVQYLTRLSHDVSSIHISSSPTSYPSRSPESRLQLAIGLTAHPVEDSSVTDQAFCLEAGLKKSFVDSGVVSQAQIDTFILERYSSCNVVSNLDSLIDLSAYDSHRVPFKIADSCSLGKPAPCVAMSPSSPIHTVTTKTIKWPKKQTDEYKEPPTNDVRARKNKQKHKPIPKGQAAEQMSARDRKNMRRAIEHHAARVQSCWRVDVELPSFSFPPIPSNSGILTAEQATVEGYELLWDWQEKCIDILHQYRNEHRGEYDYSVIELAFGNLSRLDALRGSHYMAALHALNQRIRRQAARTAAAEAELALALANSTLQDKLGSL